MSVRLSLHLCWNRRVDCVIVNFDILLNRQAKLPGSDTSFFDSFAPAPKSGTLRCHADNCIPCSLQSARGCREPLRDSCTDRAMQICLSRRLMSQRATVGQQRLNSEDFLRKTRSGLKTTGIPRSAIALCSVARICIATSGPIRIVENAWAISA